MMKAGITELIVIFVAARVDDEKCAGCGKCAEKCPVKAVELL